MPKNLPLEHQAKVVQDKAAYPNPEWQPRRKKFFFPKYNASVGADTIEEATEKANELFK